MKVAFRFIVVFLGISVQTWSQVQPANLTALHSETEKAYESRNLGKASEVANSLLEAATAAGDERETAFAELMRGQIYGMQGDYRLALQGFERSLRIYQSRRDDTGIAKVFTQQSIAYRYTQQPDIAFALLKQAREIFEGSQNKEGLARVCLELGNTYIDTDNYRSALEALQQALQFAEETDQTRLIGNITNSIGSVYSHQGNRELALEFYQRSLQIKERLSNYYEIINTLVNMSVVYTSMGRLADAHRALDRSLELARPDDPRSRAQVLNRYARILFSEKKFDDAMARSKETIQLLSGGKDIPLEGDTLVRIGQIQAETEHFNEAIETAGKAMAIAENIQSPLLKVLALEVRGVAALELHKDEEALAAFMQLIDVHEELRTNIAGDAAQIQSYLRGEGDEMHGAVELLIRLKRFEEAFQVSERNKGRALLTVLGGDDTRLARHLTADERGRETQLQHAVIDANLALEHAQRGTVGAERIRELESFVQRARLDLDAFETTLYAAHPELQVHRNRGAAVSVPEAAAILPDAKTVLLEYDLGPNVSYVFALSRDASGKAVFHVHQLDAKRQDLIAQVNAFRTKIAERDLSFREDARKLYDTLIQPAASDISGKDTLMISPDSILWQLPFQALQSSSNQSLIEKYAVFFAPSMTVLSRINQSKPAVGQPSLFAAGDATAGRELPLLKTLYGSDSRVITGTAATENAVKDAASQYRIIHLAAHGFYDDAHPMNSYLQLLRPSDESEDGKLEAREIMSMDLKAELVVLSACETARGDASGGEGLVGMTWALLVAGVPTAVASQWKVDAASTAELMIRFHRALRESNFSAKARGLQQAALAVMKNPQYRHPYYWAGFVMVGSGL